MRRHTLFVLLILGAAGPVRADNWAERLFEERCFDFGAVQRGQELTHSFRVVNNTKTTVRIVSVGLAACGGGTEAHALKYTLAPGEETAIIILTHTRVFEGVRARTIWVHFDKPSLAEVRLSVQANSRTNGLYFDPESLDFKKIKRGDTPTKHARVIFPNNSKIQVTAAKCDSKFIQVKLLELRREEDGVVYQVSATLRADIPQGKWYADIWLTTNDPAMPRLRVPVAVEVVGPKAAAD